MTVSWCRSDNAGSGQVVNGEHSGAVHNTVKENASVRSVDVDNRDHGGLQDNVVRKPNGKAFYNSNAGKAGETEPIKMLEEIKAFENRLKEEVADEQNHPQGGKTLATTRTLVAPGPSKIHQSHRPKKLKQAKRPFKFPGPHPHLLHFYGKHVRMTPTRTSTAMEPTKTMTSLPTMTKAELENLNRLER